MPLSEQEQRLLDEMERNLLHNDADVLTAAPGRAFSYRNLVYGALLILAGLGALIAGVSMFAGLGSAQFVSIIIGVVGFGLMFAGAMVAIRRTEIADHVAPEPTSRARESHHTNESFMDRMNDRWDRRQDPDR